MLTKRSQTRLNQNAITKENLILQMVNSRAKTSTILQFSKKVVRVKVERKIIFYERCHFCFRLDGLLKFIESRARNNKMTYGLSLNDFCALMLSLYIAICPATFCKH
ncbi:hypothetical protein POM88_026293 [Heracleum sosnowskyi]|uniref:Uncharacterized protein n=1 Tax=Heracleum sosnowskyi TaxID=360622 RepID=A0AAD8MP06_9APIA|nr:hypothetical protein POM88_026293 [Heracleum sosnowskyi]